MTKKIEINYIPTNNAKVMFDFLEEATLNQLEANSLDPNNLLFRAIYPSKLEQALETGTDRDKTPASLAKAEKPGYEPDKFLYAGKIQEERTSWDLKEVLQLAYQRRKQDKLSFVLHKTDEFVMLCYNQSMLELAGSFGAEWPLYKIKEGYNLKDALDAVIVYKPEKVEK